MDILSLMRTMGALAIVLGLLWGALWVVKRYHITLGGNFAAPGTAKRLRVIERAGLDAKRFAILLRRDGREHLVILSPDGNVVVESYDAPADQEPVPNVADAKPAPDFAAILAEKLKNSGLGATFAKGARGFAFRGPRSTTDDPPPEQPAQPEPAAVLALPAPVNVKEMKPRTSNDKTAARPKHAAAKPRTKVAPTRKAKAKAHA